MTDNLENTEKNYQHGSDVALTGTGNTDVEKHTKVYERPHGLKAIYYDTHTQVALLGFVCFMCPGLFNSLNGLGGGGQLKEATSANANSALYSTFAFFAFFAGYVSRAASHDRTTHDIFVQIY